MDLYLYVGYLMYTANSLSQSTPPYCKFMPVKIYSWMKKISNTSTTKETFLMRPHQEDTVQMRDNNMKPMGLYLLSVAHPFHRHLVYYL